TVDGRHAAGAHPAQPEVAVYEGAGQGLAEGDGVGGAVTDRLDLRLGVHTVGAGEVRPVRPHAPITGAAHVVGGAQLVSKVRPVPHSVIPDCSGRSRVEAVEHAAVGGRDGDVLGVVRGADEGLDLGIRNVRIARPVGATDAIGVCGVI